MKITKICFIVVQVVVLLLTLSCSNSEDSKEKGVLKEKQDRIAQDVINSIKVPLDQAQEASKLANEHIRQIEEAQKQK